MASPSPGDPPRDRTSPSGLARRAGLDPTTFNRSKRLAAGGRPRWPSTESISKILAATGRSLAEFANPGAGGRRLPLIPGDRVADGGCFDAQGLPAGGGWAEIEFPGIGDPHAYAMRVVDDARAPVYRPGDTIVLGPRSAARRRSGARSSAPAWAVCPAAAATPLPCASLLAHALVSATSPKRAKQESNMSYCN